MQPASPVPFDGIVFDFDGVICDTEWPEYEACRHAWASHGLDLTVDEWHHAIGTAAYDWQAHLATRLGLTLLPSASVEVRRARHRELVDRQPVLAGVEALLAVGLPCAIASNSPVSWVDRNLRRLGLRDRFVSIHGIDTVVNGKPAPDSYLAACASIGVAPARAVAFEDSATGVAAAKAAGLFCVAVPHALSVAHDFSRADLVVDSLASVELASMNLSSPL
ncbi:MAG: HAD family hydrolase [Acidimicrobiia bacterium]